MLKGTNVYFECIQTLLIPIGTRKNKVCCANGKFG
jgi:hypothetical protein